MAKKDHIGESFRRPKKDVVKSGGYSVFSVEVEQEILEHPTCAIAIVGVPHPTKKEVPIAYGARGWSERYRGRHTRLVRRTTSDQYKSPSAVVLVIGADGCPGRPRSKCSNANLRDRYKDNVQRRRP